MVEILEGSIVAGKSGKPMKVVRVDGNGLVLESETGIVKAKRSAIVEVLSSPPSQPQPIQIGDRLRRLPAKRTPYPARWFGEDLKGQPLPDTRPSVSEVEGVVTGFAVDGGVKVRTDDGRNFRVSQVAIELGEWVPVMEEN